MPYINQILSPPPFLPSHQHSIMKVAPLFIAGASALPVEWFSLVKQAQPALIGGAKPIVSSQEIQQHFSKEALEQRANELYDIAEKSEDQFGHPTRVIGSAGHNGTIEYILNALSDFGSDYYDVWTQQFAAAIGGVNNFSLAIDGVKYENASVFSMSPPTKNKEEVSANLASASNLGCDASDYDDVEGSVVLVSRGECPFGQKSRLAGQAGAVGALIYNNVEGEGALSGTLGTPEADHVPSLALDYTEGQALLEKLNSGADVSVVFKVDSYVANITTTNVLAQTKSGDKDNVVMLGAHSDSVDAGPGINDDGSGTISLLEVAKALTNYDVNNAVRFAWWAAEEEGLLGSDYYANSLSEEENLKVRLFMDYDMMASPNYAYQVYDGNNVDNPAGSEEIKNLYVNFYQDHGLNYTYIPFDGRSDYDGFIKNGIPGGGVATGAEVLKTEEEEAMFGGKAGVAFDPCYHARCDDLSNPDYDAWIVNTRLIAHSVAEFGKSLEGFPARQSKDSVSALQLNYHGPQLVN